MTQQSNKVDREFSKFVDSPTRLNESAIETVATVESSALPDGAATEATLQSVNSKLADLKTYTDQIEQYVDNLENLSQQIVDATDQIEPLITASNVLLTNIYAATDQVESLLTTANSTASSILSAVDQLEGYTDEVEGLLTTISNFLATNFDVALSTRASEATQISVLSKLGEIDDNTDAIETKLDSVNANLGTINTNIDDFQSANHIDLVQIDSDLNSLRTETDNNFSQVENKLDSVNSNLGTINTNIDDFKSANHTDLLGIQSRLDTIHADVDGVEAKLDTVNSNLGDIKTYTDGLEGLITSSNTKLDSVITQVTAINANTDTVESKLDTVNSNLTSFQSANHNDLLGVQTRIDTTNTEIGATNESAASTDTSTSGLNGLFKRLLQRVTTMLSTFATEVTLSLINAKLNSLGQKTRAGSVPVTMASDQPLADFELLDASSVFSFSADINAAAAGTDNPLVLLNNPIGSGKNFYIRTLKGGVTITNVSVEFKLFSNPTVTANGTAQTPRNRTITSSPTASVATLFTLPTISASGNTLAASVVGQNSNTVSINEDYSIKLTPGNSVLITGSPTSNNRNTSITFVWVER